MPDALRPVLRCTDATKTLRDLLQVNDLSVVHKNHAELVQFIKAGGGKLSMVLLASAQQMPIPHTAYPISVTRGPDGFGFNLGRKGNVHYFKGVDAGSAALAAGASLNALIFEVRVQCTTSMHIVIDARHSRGLFWSVPTCQSCLFGGAIRLFYGCFLVIEAHGGLDSELRVLIGIAVYVAVSSILSTVLTAASHRSTAWGSADLRTPTWSS